jgi:hypothetical protein
MDGRIGRWPVRTVGVPRAVGGGLGGDVVVVEGVGGRARELVGAIIVGEEGVHGGRPVVGEAEVSWAARCALQCGAVDCLRCL